MRDDSLAELADQLEAEGLDAADLRALDAELEMAERPPGLLKRLSARAKEKAAKHWANFVGELKESGEAMKLIGAAMQGRELTPAERDAIRSQILDLVRVFPASLIAAANSAFPIPGTGLFTPWILLRLGLMPSHWREAHVIDQLRKKQEQAQSQGLFEQAERLGAVADRIEHDAEVREKVSHDAELLTAWDENRNDQWDPEEIEAYLAELERVKELAEKFANRKQWYFCEKGEVFGAGRLSELEWQKREDDQAWLLVCFAGKTGWVSLAHVFGEEPTFD